MADLLARYQGCLVGLAVGDAVGTTVEFSPRETFAPVNDMVGGGPFDLQAGQWTDDTSMALCLAHSLICCQGFDAADQMQRYMNWWQWGYLSSTGTCFDIGMTVSNALQRFAYNGEPFAGSSDPKTAGNGSLMRLAPVVLWFFPDKPEVLSFSEMSSRTTHAAPQALASCRLFAEILFKALSGKNKADTLIDIAQLPEDTALRHIAQGLYRQKARSEIFGTGYCVQSLEAALWCFEQAESFEETILLAANLGDDADTTAAIAGQLAGAYYGVEGIPRHWRDRLWQCEEITTLASQLLTKTA